MKRINWPRALVLSVAILAIFGLEAWAIAHGKNGQMFFTSVVAIGSIAGSYAAAQSGIRDVLEAMDNGES